MTKVTTYLVLQASKSRSGNITGVKVVASRANKPGLLADEAAIKVTFDVPDSVFDAEAVGLVVEPRKAVLAVEQEAA